MSNSSTDFTPAHLPDGPWQVLLQYALALLDDAAKHGGVSESLEEVVKSALEDIGVVPAMPSHEPNTSLTRRGLNMLSVDQLAEGAPVQCRVPPPHIKFRVVPERRVNNASAPCFWVNCYDPDEGLGPRKARSLEQNRLHRIKPIFQT